MALCHLESYEGYKQKTYERYNKFKVYAFFADVAHAISQNDAVYLVQLKISPTNLYLICRDEATYQFHHIVFTANNGNVVNGLWYQQYHLESPGQSFSVTIKGDVQNLCADYGVAIHLKSPGQVLTEENDTSCKVLFSSCKIRTSGGGLSLPTLVEYILEIG